MILYHFTIHKGQPVVLVSMQNQGNPENMYYMYPTNNKDIQEAFANIVNGKWRFERLERKIWKSEESLGDEAFSCGRAFWEGVVYKIWYNEAKEAPMKHLKKQTLILLSISSLFLVGLAVFTHFNKKEKQPSYSNLNSKTSLSEVRSILSKHLDEGSVENFINLVEDYNDTVGSVGLTGDFKPFTKTDYDVEKISSLWTAKHDDFIGTNCRINTYMLLKGKIKIPQVKSDSELLFQDKDAIDKGKLFDAKEQANFEILFSRVKTNPTQNVKVHAKHMEDYYKQFTFDDKARMLSVIVHDNLDGDSLFVGHVGVLVSTTDGYLFVEKLTFEEPYQAIRFASKKDCYKYLTTKYKDYTGPGLAKPFIMDNGKWVDMG